MKNYAIIVAGGSGSRMKSDVPKQFLKVDGEPIIVKTIQRFQEVISAIQVIVVLPQKHLSHWELLLDEYSFLKDVITAIGGATRSDSVRSGMDKIDTEGLVAIHDAVRPFVSKETIEASFQSAQTHGSGVAVVALKDSIREIIDSSQSKARDRSDYVLVQTPQTFSVSKIKDAYKKLGNRVFTDDASVFEKAGYPVHLVDGSYSNIKITTPEDLT